MQMTSSERAMKIFKKILIYIVVEPVLSLFAAEWPPTA
jgi:hypothetical protein